MRNSLDADVVVVGAGAAGTCAALEAAGRGLRTLVLEAFPSHGGAASWSGGGTFLVGTDAQRERGILDSPELALRDWLRCGGETVDAAWAMRYIIDGSRHLDRWLLKRGVVWQGVVQEEGNSVPRWHEPRGAGEGLMRTLLASGDQLPISWSYTSAVTRLVLDDHAVVGVEVDRAGVRRTLRACAVIVATGGFANDPKMLEAHVRRAGPEERLLRGGADQSIGAGHRFLDEIGAQLVGLDRVWIYPTGMIDHRRPEGSGVVVRIAGVAIWLNTAGERFHDESRAGGGVGTSALLRQHSETCWALFGEQIIDSIAISHPTFRADGVPDREAIRSFLLSSPSFHRAPTLAELAAEIALPPASVVATVNEFNDAVRAGLDREPRFGRPLTDSAPIEGPFCALQFFPIARKNLGGVRTDLDARVVRRDGRVIPGLYAAGEVAGMAGGSINGSAALEGTMLGPSLYSGRIAGRTAARDLPILRILGSANASSHSTGEPGRAGTATPTVPTARDRAVTW